MLVNECNNVCNKCVTASDGDGPAEAHEVELLEARVRGDALGEGNRALVFQRLVVREVDVRDGAVGGQKGAECGRARVADVAVLN